jgi:hypoxanthine-DNA glycosylase
VVKKSLILRDMKNSFAPLVGEDPGILILGTLPGEASLRAGEYYAHRSNRFWPLIAHLTGEPLPQNYDDKKRLLARHRIALWDVVHSANRTGSADAKIIDEAPNDLVGFLRRHPSIHTVAFNGKGRKGAEGLFTRHFGGKIVGPRFLTLLSTSPANCQFTDAEMRENWARLFSTETPNS